MAAAMATTTAAAAETAAAAAAAAAATMAAAAETAAAAADSSRFHSSRPVLLHGVFFCGKNFYFEYIFRIKSSAAFDSTAPARIAAKSAEAAGPLAVTRFPSRSVFFAV